MSNHRVGMHWIRTHPDGRDLAHVERMQYPSVKLFEWHWSDRNACRDLLTVLPKDAYILARDHPMSEQKQDMWNDPVGTGTRHANEWAKQVAMGNVHTPAERTFFLGINEPDATSGDRNAIDRYTAAYLERLQVHGLRGGAFNFSTGHPRTVDGTGATKADYSVFEGSHRAIIRGHHIAVAHIYGTANVPCVPGHYDRLRACPWHDVQWVIGECAIDQHVLGGGAHDGYLRALPDKNAYCRWLDELIMGINDPRIHSYQIFTYDFSHPWDSFDVRPIREALESYDWQHAKTVVPTVPNTQPTTTHLPSIGSGAPAQPSGPTATINVPAGANIRTGPGASYSALGALPNGTVLQVVGKNQSGEWWHVLTDRGTGWISTTVVRAQNVNGVPVTKVEAPQPQPQGDNFKRCLPFILRWEGSWADDPRDSGGATMKGITIGTYTRWREAHGQPKPTKDDLRNISDAEVERIYFEWYWKASNSDKLAWPLCLANFDTAVNAGPGRAEEMLQRSGGSFLAYMGHLIDWYTRIPNFEHFGRAWIRRRAEILLEAV